MNDNFDETCNFNGYTENLKNTNILIITGPSGVGKVFLLSENNNNYITYREP